MISTWQAHLVESIIQTLVQVLQVQQDNRLTSLHAHLDPIDISTNLKINISISLPNKYYNTTVICYYAIFFYVSGLEVLYTFFSILLRTYGQN